MDIEKGDLPKTFEELVNRARKIELASNKYVPSANGSSSVETSKQRWQQPRSNKRSSSTSGEDIASLSGAISELADDLHALKINLVERQPRRQPFRCYTCGEEGHKSNELRRDTGDQQDQPSQTQKEDNNPIHLVETAEVYATQKRKQAEVISDASGRTIKKNMLEPSINPVLPTKKITMNDIQDGQANTEAKRKRQPPRKLQVDLHKKNIWDTLKQVDAGLSVANWLALDNAASQDLTAGLRYLHGRKSRISEKVKNNNQATKNLKRSQSNQAWQSRTTQTFLLVMIQI
ncbi:hypothetical protein BDC45DRAFT_542475 [Circinella umbellata]|nr:hypothetical protein BDC45DRAFT_542475 [Circinella umbellata]